MKIVEVDGGFRVEDAFGASYDEFGNDPGVMDRAVAEALLARMEAIEEGRDAYRREQAASVSRAVEDSSQRRETARHQPDDPYTGRYGCGDGLGWDGR